MTKQLADDLAAFRDILAKSWCGYFRHCVDSSGRIKADPLGKDTIGWSIHAASIAAVYGKGSQAEFDIERELRRNKIISALCGYDNSVSSFDKLCLWEARIEGEQSSHDRLMAFIDGAIKKAIDAEKGLNA